MMGSCVISFAAFGMPPPPPPPPPLLLLLLLQAVPDPRQ
jgi:hypothetical protein